MIILKLSNMTKHVVTILGFYLDTKYYYLLNPWSLLLRVMASFDLVELFLSLELGFTSNNLYAQIKKSVKCRFIGGL